MNDINTDDVQVQIICIHHERKKNKARNNLKRILLVFFIIISFVWKCYFLIRLFGDFIVINRLDII